MVTRGTFELKIVTSPWAYIFQFDSSQVKSTIPQGASSSGVCSLLWHTTPAALQHTLHLTKWGRMSKGKVVQLGKQQGGECYTCSAIIFKIPICLGAFMMHGLVAELEGCRHHLRLNKITGPTQTSVLSLSLLHSSGLKFQVVYWLCNTKHHWPKINKPHPHQCGPQPLFIPKLSPSMQLCPCSTNL